MTTTVAYAVFYILWDLSKYSEVINAWYEAGVPGITELESAGTFRAWKAIRNDITFMPSLEQLMDRGKVSHRTLLSVVPDLEFVHRLVDVTEQIVGDLNEEETGILFVLPVAYVKGLRSTRGS